MPFPNETPTETEFYAEVGRILTTWATIERSLSEIFCNSFNPQAENHHVAYNAYWSIHSFEAKLKITNSAFKSAYEDNQRNKKLHSDWNTLKNRLLSRNKTRNKIAHGGLVRVGTGELYFAPYAFGGPAIFGKSHGAFDLASLSSTLVMFNQDEKDLTKFSRRMTEKRMREAPILQLISNLLDSKP